MNIVSGSIAHRVRANVLEGEVTRRLGAGALEQEEAGTSPPRVASLPYKAVSGIRLSYAPSRVDTARYRCDIRLAEGQSARIYSTHYVGIAEFEDVLPRLSTAG